MESMNEYLSQERMWGIVTKYDKERRFGFIRSKVDARYYFVHASQIQDGILAKGYLVEFGVGINRKTEKEEAKNVIVIEAPAHSSMRKINNFKGEKRYMKNRDNTKRVPHCSECEFMKKYDYGYRVYYCDHADRTDDMGKLSVDVQPKTKPVWCPLRKK